MSTREQMQRLKRNRHLRQRHMVYELANAFLIRERDDTYTICNVILPNADQLERERAKVFLCRTNLTCIPKKWEPIRTREREIEQNSFTPLKFYMCISANGDRLMLYNVSSSTRAIGNSFGKWQSDHVSFTPEHHKPNKN